jgi:hypothetical protein
MEGHVKRAVVLALTFGVLRFLPVAAQVDSSLPRFRQRQIRIESPGKSLVLPGRWLAAAAALGETSGAMRAAYTELTLRSGLSPLPPDSLGRFGLFRVMGLYRREELTTATVEMLTRLRTNLRNDTALARFDYLFRPNGRWQVDIHDVALARSRRPFPTISWQAVRPVLASAGLIDSTPDLESVPLALYRLYVQSETDSAAFQSTQSKLRQSDPAAAAQVSSLINSYGDAAQWFVTAVRFLLEERWILTGETLRSPAELVRRTWQTNSPMPEIRVRTYGYPEGAVRIGTDSILLHALLRAENPSAGEWLKRNGGESLVEVLHRLSLPANDHLRLKVGAELYRLSSIEQYARESFSGFLEPKDQILLDSSYQPVLALGTLIHEWQHILGERARRSGPPNGAYRVAEDEVTFVPLDPFMAEGFAEWLTEEILQGVLQDFPLIGFGETEKRISLAQSDPHQLGYLLVRTLARTLGDPRATRLLLIRTASNPELVTRDPRVRRAWTAHQGTDRTIGRRGEPVLIPQSIFTIEDGHPDLVQSQIIAPYIPRR